MRKVKPITARQLAEFQGRLVRFLEEHGVDGDEFQTEFVQGFDGVADILFQHLTPNWLKAILKKECQCHRDFFGQEFDLSSFKETLKKYDFETISRWQELGLEPHYLPPELMSQDAEFPGWKVKPENWYYQKVAEGKILRQQVDGSLKADKEAYRLEGITILVDTRLNPRYGDGKQMFKNDNLLGSIVEQLRKGGKIAKYEYGPQPSRFGVSVEEWEAQVRPALAKFLSTEVCRVRLERVIEANIIPQLYPCMPREKDGETNTWVWYEEYFEDASDRLYGGYSVWGGLSGVVYDRADSRWSDRAFRPLVVLGD